MNAARLWPMLVLVAGTVGCGPVNRETKLVGNWEADSAMMAIKAAKLKQDNPNASVSEVMGGARALTNVGISLKKDKTFELFFNGVTRKGTWTFDKENGEVQLHITESKPLNPELKIPENEKATWTAILSEDNDKLTFYPIAPEGVRMVLASVKGTPPGAMFLYKK